MPITLENVEFTYMAKTPYERKALQGVSLTVDKGEFVAVIGHTGSGKSTLVQHLNGLLKPSAGKVTIDGLDISGKGEAVKKARHQVGMVFQYPEHQIFAETVFEDIAFGPRNKGMQENEVKQQVQDAMRFVGLDFETFASRSPFQLSGGQMRRVAIAGVIAMDPDYLILDEPSAGLDPRSRDAVFAEIMALYKKRRMAVILVTHSMEEAARYSNRLLVISGGRVILDGSPAEIYQNHKNELLAVSMDVPQLFKLSDELRARGITLFFIVAIFLASGAVSYGILWGFVFLIILLSRLPLMLVLKSIKPLWIIIVLTMVIHMFTGQGENVIFSWKFFKVTQEGLEMGLKMSMRLILLLLISSILTFTTSPIVLTDGIEALLRPFKRFGVPAHELAMMMTIALRFIPTLLEETDRIMKAQTARGADFSSGNLMQRAKNMLPLLIPLFISAFRRADDLAVAMEARCYRGGEGRSRMHELVYYGRDYAALATVFVLIGLMAFIRWGNALCVL